jgi:hypothetical protein
MLANTDWGRRTSVFRTRLLYKEIYLSPLYFELGGVCGDDGAVVNSGA